MPNGATIEGEFEMAIELPDKFIRRDVLAAIGNMSVYRISGFNGDGVIKEVDTPPQLSGGGHTWSCAFSRPRRGSGRSSRRRPNKRRPAPRSAADARRNFARIALGMFVTSLPSYPLTFTTAGRRSRPMEGRGDRRQGRGQFAARLFMDTRPTCR